MSLSNKREVDVECRVFQETWTEYYLLTEVNAKPVCLVCNQHVAVLQEYSIRRHYDTHHRDKFHNLQGQLRKDKIHDLLAGLKKRQYAFTRSRDVSDGAVKASYLIGNELVQASKPFSDGEFVKICMMKVVEVVWPEKQFAFADISLSRDTIADRVEDISRNLCCRIQDKIKLFTALLVENYDNADVTDTAQLCVFIRGVDESLTATEEFLELVPMKNTTAACDIFWSLFTAPHRAGVIGSRAVSLAADGARSMVGRNPGVATTFREKVQAASGGQDFLSFHCILHQKALWCKTQKMDHVMSVAVQTVDFIRARGLNHRQFDCLLNVNYIPVGLPYHTEVRW